LRGAVALVRVGCPWSSATRTILVWRMGHLRRDVRLLRVQGPWSRVSDIVVGISSSAIRRTGVGIFTLMLAFRVLLACIAVVSLVLSDFVLRPSTSGRTHLVFHAARTALHPRVASHWLLRSVMAVSGARRVHLPGAVVWLGGLITMCRAGRGRG